MSFFLLKWCILISYILILLGGHFSNHPCTHILKNKKRAQSLKSNTDAENCCFCFWIIVPYFFFLYIIASMLNLSSFEIIPWRWTYGTHFIIYEMRWDEIVFVQCTLLAWLLSSSAWSRSHSCHHLSQHYASNFKTYLLHEQC